MHLKTIVNLFLRYRNICRLVASVMLLAIFPSTLSAADTFSQCVSKLAGAKTMKVNFTTNLSGRNASGTLKSKGAKFAISVAGVSTWYDGKDMWTYTPTAGEATVWHPTSSELAETNPLLYLSKSADYIVKLTKTTKSESVYTLTPKKRNTGVKSVVITINNSTLLPKNMRISVNGGAYNVSFSSISLNTGLLDSEFVFPRTKYKGVPVTDLR